MVGNYFASTMNGIIYDAKRKTIIRERWYARKLNRVEFYGSPSQTLITIRRVSRN